jgi:hypothetical protein
VGTEVLVLGRLYLPSQEDVVEAVLRVVQVRQMGALELLVKDMQEDQLQVVMTQVEEEDVEDQDHQRVMVEQVKHTQYLAQVSVMEEVVRERCLAKQQTVEGEVTDKMELRTEEVVELEIITLEDLV